MCLNLQAFSRVGCSILTRFSVFDSLINSGKEEYQIIRITLLVFQKCCCESRLIFLSCSVNKIYTLLRTGKLL